MDDVRPAEAVPHLAELRLGAVWQREERDERFRERHVHLAARRLFTRLDPHLAAGEWIDLAEQAQLHFARKEPVFAAREGTAVRLLHIVLREAAHEVAGDTHVEQELAGAALLVEPERLTWTQELGRRRWAHLRLWIRRRLCPRTGLRRRRSLLCLRLRCDMLPSFDLRR